MKQIILVLAGAVAGGAVGYAVCWWLGEHGFYSVAIPGVLLGLGAGIAKNRSVVLAVICGLLAVGVGLVAEWLIFPFKDESLGYFLRHIPNLSPVTLLMIAVGGLIGFWVPFSRIEKRPRQGQAGGVPQVSEPANIPPEQEGKS